MCWNTNDPRMHLFRSKTKFRIVVTQFTRSGLRNNNISYCLCKHFSIFNFRNVRVVAIPKLLEQPPTIFCQNLYLLLVGHTNSRNQFRQNVHEPFSEFSIPMGKYFFSSIFCIRQLLKPCTIFFRIFCTNAKIVLFQYFFASTCLTSKLHYTKNFSWDIVQIIEKRKCETTDKVRFSQRQKRFGCACFNLNRSNLKELQKFYRVLNSEEEIARNNRQFIDWLGKLISRTLGVGFRCYCETFSKRSFQVASTVYSSRNIS